MLAGDAMKVIVLGSGGMGRYAAKTAVTFDFVGTLTVADLDAAAATRLAATLGPKACAVGVDVTDAPALERLLAGAGAVLNTVGPFVRLGPPVLRAAIRARCHYLDINDDWESTVAMLEMDDAARAAGITAVIGMGASPGISNLLAVTAMRELDAVEELYPGFDLDAAMRPDRGGERARFPASPQRRRNGLPRLSHRWRGVRHPEFPVYDQVPRRRFECTCRPVCRAECPRRRRGWCPEPGTRAHLTPCQSPQSLCRRWAMPAAEVTGSEAAPCDG